MGHWTLFVWSVVCVCVGDWGSGGWRSSWQTQRRHSARLCGCLCGALMAHDLSRQITFLNTNLF